MRATQSAWAMGLGAGWALLAGAVAQAQVHPTDVILSVNAGRVTTGAVSPCTGEVVDQRIFRTNLGAFDTINDPGFDSPIGSLPVGARVGFDILGSLKVWNGSDFSQTASPRLRIRLGGAANTRFTPADQSVVTGFGFTVGSDGAYHHHFNFSLFSQAAPPAIPAEAGVYLLTLRMWCDAPGIAPSEPIWLVINQLRPEAELDAAFNWQAQNAGVRGVFVCCLADVTGIGGPPAQPDGLVTGDDFNAYIAAFAAGEPLADVTGIGGPPSQPDGLVTGDDFNAFIAAFASGCP
ncbi:MAG: hypothetical protein LW650_06365 [Planctomycetaceae bacterium]|nr:hypothetical protein [Planctomycetaceae bacterium]